MDSPGRIVDLNVRGKRKRVAGRSPASASSSSRPRGRPMKTASELKAAKKARTAPPLKVNPAARTQSRLEQLPVELIEQVFLHAVEVNMARASPFLAKILSTESIYRTLILFAFFADDESSPVETEHFAPTTYRVLSLEEKLRLQKGVLECAWCTLPRIKQYLPILRRLAVFQAWHQDRQRANGQAAALIDNLPDFDKNTTQSALFSTDYICFGFNVRYLPKRLLGPVSWLGDDEKVEFLSLLFHNCEEIETLNPDMTALLRGTEMAIHERQWAVLDLLLLIQFRVSHAVGHKASLDPERFLDLLHLATRQEEDSSDIVEALVGDGRRHLLPKDDKVLMKWAIARLEEEADDDGFARWYLEEAADDASFAKWYLER